MIPDAMLDWAIHVWLLDWLGAATLFQNVTLWNYVSVTVNESTGLQSQLYSLQYYYTIHAYPFRRMTTGSSSPAYLTLNSCFLHPDHCFRLKMFLPVTKLDSLYA